MYTKNILGDITGVINYETSEYLYRYSYDAYGNYELIPTGNDAGSVLFATILSGLNPLSYRGYIFTPAIGISHYLGSRFYVPTLCRFMNADVYADTLQGVVGTNMFAYCNNNPVMFVDPEGTQSNTMTQGHTSSNDVFFTLLLGLFALCQLFTSGLISNQSSIPISIPSSVVSAREKAITKIKNKVKDNGKSQYWKATLESENGYLYVEIHLPISYSSAVKRMKNGKNVFTTYSKDAYKVAKNAGNGIPMYHYECEHGYFSHYHMYNHSNASHIWYLF